MNAFLIENMAYDRIRDIEADVKKHRCKKNSENKKVDRTYTMNLIVRLIRILLMRINSIYSH